MCFFKADLFLILELTFIETIDNQKENRHNVKQM